MILLFDHLISLIYLLKPSVVIKIMALAIAIHQLGEIFCLHRNKPITKMHIFQSMKGNHSVIMKENQYKIFLIKLTFIILSTQSKKIFLEKTRNFIKTNISSHRIFKNMQINFSILLMSRSKQTIRENSVSFY